MPPTCHMDDCTKTHQARGLCRMHYQRWLTWGDPYYRVPGGRQRTDAAKRFRSYVRVDGECWLWTGWCDTDGYGGFWYDNRRHRAHRWSYEHHVGPIPDGLVIDHLCRNPPCVNPAHLEPVTQRVNSERGEPNVCMANARKTHCKHGHEFTEANTHWRKTGGRSCRKCACIVQMRAVARRKARLAEQ